MILQFYFRRSMAVRFKEFAAQKRVEIKWSKVSEGKWRATMTFRNKSAIQKFTAAWARESVVEEA